MKLIKTEPVLCIDPGTTHSGVVIFDGLNITQIDKEWENNHLLEFIRMGRSIHSSTPHMVIEGIASYGMAVGATTFETVEWIGRFRQEFEFRNTTRIFRKDIKMFLCNSMRAKDKNIRQRILDIFPATGGGKTPQVGTKGEPGPLFGVSSHSFSALALGLTYKYAPKS